MATTLVREPVNVNTGATDESMVEAPDIKMSPLLRIASKSSPIANAEPLASVSDTDI